MPQSTTVALVAVMAAQACTETHLVLRLLATQQVCLSQIPEESLSVGELLEAHGSTNGAVQTTD